jgi:hypothetical protein
MELMPAAELPAWGDWEWQPPPALKSEANSSSRQMIPANFIPRSPCHMPGLHGRNSDRFRALEARCVRVLQKDWRHLITKLEHRGCFA